MRQLLTIITFLLIPLSTFGAGTSDNTYIIGKTDAVAERRLCLNAACTNIIRVESGGGDIEFSNDGGSLFKKIGSGGGGGTGINLGSEINLDFEAGDPPTNWTESGGTFISEGTVGVRLFDNQSGSWDASAAAQTLDWDAVLVEVGLRSQSCAAQIWYKYDSGSNGDYQLVALDGSSNELVAPLDLQVTTTAGGRKEFVRFDCPASGNVQLRIKSTADGGVILFDNAHIGSNPNEVQVASANLAGEFWYQSTAACSWSVTNTAATVFPTQAACPAISSKNVDSGVIIDASDDDLPNWVFTSLPPGKYEATITGTLQGATATAEVGVWLFDDTAGDFIAKSNPLNTAATNAGYPFTMQATFTQTLAGPKTFTIHGSASSGSVSLSTSYLSATTGDHGLKMILKKFPIDSQSALSFNLADWEIDANMGGANISLSAVDETTYLEATNTGLDLVLNPGSASAEIACISGTASEGLTCNTAAVAESIGIAFIIPVAGKYEVCLLFEHRVDVRTTTGASVDAVFQIMETNNTDTTILKRGHGTSASKFYSNSTAATIMAMPHKLCGRFQFSSAGKKTFRLMYEQDTDTTVSSNLIPADRASILGEREMHWTANRLSERRGGITFNNLVSSSALAGRKITSANVTDSAGTPTLDQQDGTWIGIIDDNGDGDYTLNQIGGTWTVKPNCTCSNSDSNQVNCNLDSVGTASIDVNIRRLDTGAAIDGGFSIICVGQE